MTQLIFWVIGLLVGIILTIILTDPIHILLVRLFGDWIPRRKRGVRGIWKARYSYEKLGHEREENQLIELRQVGNYVRGKVLIGQSHKHKFWGKVQSEIYFTGIWRSIRPGEINHGSFQVVISLKGDKMRGEWIGFNNRNIVQHGPWEWNLQSKKLDSNTKSNLISDFKSKYNEVK